MVSSNGEPTRIPEEQINAVRRVLESGFTSEVHPYLTQGDLVKIVTGPLMGLKGFIVEHRGSNKFIISIDGVCQSLAVNINSSNLRLVSKRQLKVTQKHYFL
jgi:transcription antitermination factor NusG